MNEEPQYRPGHNALCWSPHGPVPGPTRTSRTGGFLVPNCSSSLSADWRPCIAYQGAARCAGCERLGNPKTMSGETGVNVRAGKTHWSPELSADKEPSWVAIAAVCHCNAAFQHRMWRVLRGCSGVGPVGTRHFS